MNKVRLIRIYELRGKIHPIEQIVIDLLDGIDKNNKGKYIVYGKDDNVYFSYNLNTNNIIYLNEILDNFGCSFEETREIMKYLLEKHLKIEINIVY